MRSDAWRRAKVRSEAKPEAKARKRAREEASKTGRSCGWCGAIWQVKPTRLSRYCSPRCARYAQLPPPSCRIPPGHPALPPTPLALPAGRAQKQSRRDSRDLQPIPPRRFTSGRCQWCHSHFVALGRYRRSRCSKKCDRAYFAKLRRAQAREAGYETVSRAAVFERDAWVCYLCGEPTDRQAQAPYSRLAATLDHVVPLSKGGPHTMSNLRTAHFACNSSKGNRPWIDQMRLVR